MRNLSSALEIAGRTDTGRVREHNEDAIFFDPDLGLVVLADGMGGYNAGEVASGITIEVIAELMRAQISATPPHIKTAGSLLPVAHEMLLLAIDRANSLIYQTAHEHPQCAGMGTTVVAGLFYNNHLALAHVGDSRAYRWRNAQLVQLSKDHSFLQEQIDAGLLSLEEARHAPYKNLVTRAVGVNEVVQTELREYEVEVGDVYLFCSDGLSDMLEDDSIAQLIGVFKDQLPQASNVLIEHANAEGGRDNISVILIKIVRDFQVESKIWNKVTGWFGGNA
ncbi:Stp1/IreP family PP2C-type Ser/Thr phosphatase [Chitinibacter sp. GC72]|uniref:Stp1/IreP family PP2C-type Ser/Thr phosphatase n=1 Tax=Chitinibacter sp. GC72 TaxID=1526917 RepID=UPI0012F8CF1E|nr:Stp1/IreP family PP2C-type Ser/Thr phosphatase [Chitinibacter sp. GC72]